MNTKQPANMPKTLSEARCQLDNWRSQRPNKRTRLPKEFWRKAVTLAKEHGLNKTARALNVKYYSLKKHLDEAGVDEGCGKRRRQHPTPARQTSGKPAGSGSPERIDLDRSELEMIMERAKTALSQAEYDKLHAAMETLIYLTQELEKNRVSVQRLKHLLFGTTTEKTQKVMEKILDEAEKKKHASDDAAEGEEAENLEKAQGAWP